MSPRTSLLQIATLATATLSLAALTAACGPSQQAASDVPVVVVPATQPDPSAAASASASAESAARIDRRYIGVWLDLETRARHTIAERNGELAVTSIIDDDGEPYEIRSTRWDGSTLKWTYFVPSTGVVVNLRTKSVKGDSLMASWANDTDHGTQEFERLPEEEQ